MCGIGWLGSENELFGSEDGRGKSVRADDDDDDDDDRDDATRPVDFGSFDDFGAIARGWCVVANEFDIVSCVETMNR